MSENMYCKNQKATSDKYREEWNKIFRSHALDDSGHRFCNECGMCMDCNDCKCGGD